MEITEHELVPSFRILSNEEKENLLEKLKAREDNLPVILPSDPMLGKEKPKTGDVLEITRKSQTSGKSLYYRIVGRE